MGTDAWYHLADIGCLDQCFNVLQFSIKEKGEHAILHFLTSEIALFCLEYNLPNMLKSKQKKNRNYAVFVTFFVHHAFL